jgi:hypothetical protein
MQTMVAALFTRLRTLPSEDDLTVHTLSSAVSLSNTFEKDARDANSATDGVRMSAPDPRSAHIPAAAGAAEVLAPQQPAYMPEKPVGSDIVAYEINGDNDEPGTA